MEIWQSIAQACQRRATWRQAGEKISFVPTMGALHDGHLRLVHEATKAHDRVVVSIFVNPLQFGEGEDFSSYPRGLDQDVAKLKDLNVDAVFAPTASELYPEEQMTYVDNPKGSDCLCGLSRPGHFRGVLTVVTKLFHLIQPDTAFFGEKDYQQLYLIKRMVKDLGMEVQIEGVPTVREQDGLAMSSRNLRLSSEERQIAPMLFQALSAARQRFLDGERDEHRLRQAFLEVLPQDFFLDYAEIRQSDLGLYQPVHPLEPRLFVAARLGSVRLIDHLKLSE